MIRIDRELARRSFERYVGQYDMSDVKIRLKAEHTYRVADLAKRIAGSLALDPSFVEFAWILGLLHDIGRFEQVRRFGTFNDAISLDHAEFGADILFREGYIEDFLPELPDAKADRNGIVPDVSGSELDKHEQGENDCKYWIGLAEAAIRNHNKLKLAENLDDQTRCFANILRDADKADIFRVLAEIPFKERVSGYEDIPDQIGARDEIMSYVYRHACVPRLTRRTAFETLICHACMAFEFVFEETRKIVKEQGYLCSYLAWEPRGKKEEEQLSVLKKELGEALHI